LQLLIAGFSRIAKLFMNHPPRYDRLIIALNDDELVMFLNQLLVAGNETTRNLIILEAEDAFLRWEETSGQARLAREAARLWSDAEPAPLLSSFSYAALAAAAVGRIYFEGLNNQVAARGWFARGRTMLADEGECVERGWVELGLVGCSVTDVGALATNLQMVALDC